MPHQQNKSPSLFGFVALPTVIFYLLQAVASSLVEITPSSCDILLFKQKLDQNNHTNYLKHAAIFVHVSKSTMGWGNGKNKKTGNEEPKRREKLNGRG